MSSKVAKLEKPDPRAAITDKPVIPSVKEILGPDYTEALQVAFPDVPPPYFPVGTRILVQLRTPGAFKTMLNGQKLFIPDEARDNEKFRIQTGLVRALAPAAFCNRATMEPWPEGEWCVPGEFVRLPLYGGDRVTVPLNDEWKREAIFVTLNDSDIVGVIYGDPLTIKTLL